MTIAEAGLKASAPEGQHEEQREEQRDTVDPYIDSEMCTSCDECIGVSNKVFAYNTDKQSLSRTPREGPTRSS